MSNRKYILSQLQRIRRDHSKKLSDDELPTIKYLQELLNKCSLHEKYMVLHFLSVEYGRYGMEEREEDVIRQATVLFPNEPAAWVGLAEYLINCNKNPDEALAAVKTAIDIAKKQNSLIRYSLNSQARVAKKIGDYKLLEQTIKELIDYKPIKDDFAYEKDFLLNLPDGVVDKNLVNQYLEVSRLELSN